MTIEKLSTLRIGLGTTVKTRIDAGKNTCETDNKNRIKKFSLSPLRYFIEHITNALEKQSTHKQKIDTVLPILHQTRGEHMQNCRKHS
jgi:hypothetical protein